MKKVYIKYNPYKLETVITVEGRELAENSKLREKIQGEVRMQEWIEELPTLLLTEYNDTEFEIEFYGTLLDYEDLVEVFKNAYAKGELTAKVDRIPAKETDDKEVLIDKIFEKIQKGPFEELRDEQIINSFEAAKGDDFEVCVVATMSAGKSTLINAMLNEKLMPSRDEACTAMITRIKDCDTANRYSGEVYRKDEYMPSDIYDELTYPIMEKLNSDPNVSEIHMVGNIPFVKADDTSLVLIDTPGPNNARDTSHRKKQSQFLSKSSKALVLYIMTATFGTDDDNSLLKTVAESMSVAGKQSKDRFIFVINKMDNRKKEDGDTNQSLERVREYLKTHGIDNPNLFPTAAYPALNIRLAQSGHELDEDEIEELELKIKKLNRNEMLHLEEYSPLPSSEKSKINARLSEVRENWTGRENENPEEALIHSGVVSVEAAIRQYVQKYAKTAKIKNIVDTFIHKLNELNCQEATKQEFARRTEEKEIITKNISKIKQKIEDAESAKKFKSSVDDAVIAINDDAKDVVNGIVLKFQERIQKRIEELRDEELTISEAEDEVERLGKFAKKLDPDFEVELDELIRKSIIDTSNTLLANYRKKLQSLTDEIDLSSIGIEIDPLKMMDGNIVNTDFSTRKLIQQKEVEDGEEWVKNTDKKWYKPWTWFQESGYTRKKYKTVEYIDGAALAQEFFKPIEEHLYNNGESACKQALKQSKKIAEHFNAEFDRLDKVLTDKLNELDSYVSDEEKAKQRIAETQERLDWLNEIISDVESILEI